MQFKLGPARKFKFTMAARATFGCNNIRITKSEFVVCGKDSFPMFTYDACTIVHCTYRILVKPMKS